ncbi:MAG TPA: DUF1906 domain-containing protein [Gaiellaceae bacterium]|nr:DUF1906 domain-containing protein [Gaiellaceae bacterium]
MRRAGVLVTLFLACAIAIGGSNAATKRAQVNVFTGYGFDACTAPALDALSAWSASPYRALGIYIGGVNRACGQKNLSATWVAGATAAGWSLLPLYVGLQAPCATQAGLQKISSDASTAQSQGVAAANDAVANANVYGLPAGSPIYLDLEGYATKNAACTRSAQAFAAGWDNQLRAVGYVAGIYGSAASTIRDLQSIGVSIPDDVWIAHWNGDPNVFGDQYVSDSLWVNHQRIHQFKGGHKETWGGVTINIDNDFVDAAVVGGSAPPPPPPPPPSGSVGSGDSLATASWPSGAFDTTSVVTLTPVAPPPAPATYAVRLSVMQADGVTPVTTFAAPVDVHLVSQGAGLVPSFSTDGVNWTPLKRQTTGTLAAGVTAAYTAAGDGSFDVYTLVPGLVGLLPDTAPPTQTTNVRGRFSNGSLVLSWSSSVDNSGVIASYNVLLDGTPLVSLPGTQHQAAVRAFHPTAQTVYRVQAVDGAGNAAKASRPIVVVPTTKPAKLPRPLPHWAWSLFSWQHRRTGARPKAPAKPAAWYWRWAAWRAAPFRVKV